MSSQFSVLTDALRGAISKNPALAKAYVDEQASLTAAAACADLLARHGLSEVATIADSGVASRVGLTSEQLYAIAHAESEVVPTFELLEKLALEFGETLDLRFTPQAVPAPVETAVSRPSPRLRL